MHPPSASPAPAPLHAQDPREIGPYRVVGRLGAGGMGTVYAALDTAGTCVAVKMIKPELAADASYRAAFDREVSVLCGLRVLCAPQMLGADAAADQPWVATEYVPGRTLSAHVREHGPLQGAALLAFAAGTAEALQALHASDVIHRDIKPSNVVLSPDGPRVLDFGIARRAQDEDSSEQVYGTPGYIAPERLAGRQDSAAADIFAWGGLVAFATLGRSPFAAEDSAAVLERTRAAEHDIVGMPQEIASLVGRALSLAPEERPTASECFLQSLALGWQSQIPGDREGGDDQHRLAGLLKAVWRGFDNAGHDPRTWAALAGGAGIVGGVTAAVTTAAAPSAAGAGGAALGGAASAGGGGAAAGVGMTSTGASAAGVLSTKAVVLTAGGVLTLAAAGGGGYYASQVAAANERQEAVEQAAQVLTDGEGFAAEFTRLFTGEQAEENTAEGGPELTVETPQAASAMLDVRYTTGEQSVFRTELLTLDDEELEANDMRKEIVANVDGQIHAYTNPYTPRASRSWYASTDRFTADSYSLDTIVEPLHRLAGAEDLAEEDAETIAGTETTRYSGSFLLPAVLGAEDGELEAVGDVWLDEAGSPVQLRYNSSEWEISVEFTETDSPVDVEEPENVDSQGPGLSHYTPACGEVNTADGVEYSVRAYAWEVDCERAMTVASTLVEGTGTLVENWSDTRSQWYHIDDFACFSYIEQASDAPVPSSCHPTNGDDADQLDREDAVDDDAWNISFSSTEYE